MSDYDPHEYFIVAVMKPFQGPVRHTGLHMLAYFGPNAFSINEIL